MKKRQGEEFTLIWEVMMNKETPINTDGISEEGLILKNGTEKRAINFKRNDNVLQIDIKAEMTKQVGVYGLEYSYEEMNNLFEAFKRERTVTADAFEIVPKTEAADDVCQFSIKTILV